jgi:flagellar basal-body rod protein FlgB
MDLSGLPLIQLLTRRMAWLSQRQEVLSANIANADTPGFRPSDVAPMDFRTSLMASGGGMMPVSTNPMHIGAAVRDDGPFAIQIDRKVEMSPDKNGVDIEDQMVKMAQTQSDYQLITNLYRKQVGMIKIALGRGGS